MAHVVVNDQTGVLQSDVSVKLVRNGLQDAMVS